MIMRKPVALLSMLLCLWLVSPVYPQETTRIIRIRIDGNDIETNYEIYFQIRDKWVRAKKNSSRFVIPKELRNENFLTFVIAFDKYRTQFSEIHASKFAFDWSVGVEERIISDEHVRPEERCDIKTLTFIDFLGSGTSAVVVEKKE